MPDVTFITDTPTQLDATGDLATSRIQVAEIGRFKDPRYGSFGISASDVRNWKTLLDSHFQGRVPIDLDHRTDKGVSSEAAGWITGLEQTGNRVHAQVEWTTLGESAIREKRYLYISPTFTEALKDKNGKALGPALLRAALTNNPFLRDMPAVSLSAATSFEVAERITEDPDSPPVMPDFSKFAKALSLSEDATEDQILTALADATKPPVTKTLEAMAAEGGKVLLDAEEANALRADSDKVQTLESKVQTLEETAHNQIFDSAYSAARVKGQVDAKDETRELWRAQYDATGDAALKLLSRLPEAINLAGRVREQEAGGANDDVSAERHELHQKVLAYAAEHKVDYSVALEAVAF